MVRRLHGLQMMKATVQLSVCDVYTRLCTVLHACAVGHELHSRHVSVSYARVGSFDATRTAGGEVGSSAARLANDASYRLVERM